MNDFFDESQPLDYEGLSKAAARLKKKRRCLRVSTVGSSVLGRKLFCFTIGKGKPTAVYVGGVHALEYITSMLLLQFTGELCEHFEAGDSMGGYDIRKELSDRALCIIPMLNPDGVEIHLKGAVGADSLKNTVRHISQDRYDKWQANAHGVDLNHNFDAGFDILRRNEIDCGITGPRPRQYGGEAPESEPETQALCRLCRKQKFEKSFAFHSQGEEIYWNYGSHTPTEALEMANQLAESSGYTVCEPEGLASHGGFKDWFIETFARPGFTIEVGLGVNPLPVSDMPGIYDKLRDMLVLGMFI